MISKRNLTYIGSVLMIVLFAAGITAMAAGLTDLPSIPSNTTPAATAALTDGTAVLTTDATTGVTVAADATTGATVVTDASGATVLATTGSATVTSPSVDVVAQATATQPDGDDDDEDDDDEDDDRIIDPSIQLITKNAAAAIALAQVGNGTVVEIELDGDDNPPLYKIKLIAGNIEYDIKVHAVTGALLDLEKESVERSDSDDDD